MCADIVSIPLLQTKSEKYFACKVPCIHTLLLEQYVLSAAKLGPLIWSLLA